LGVAYKQDIDDYRESPAIRVIEELEKVGANVEFYDPWIAKYKENGVFHEGLKELTPDVVAAYDLVMITTAHTNVDYEMVQKNAKAIFDTKNVMKTVTNKTNVEVL
jgi:UDP-N-acetyl-D-glucosamine dehydrogenase